MAPKITMTVSKSNSSTFGTATASVMMRNMKKAKDLADADLKKDANMSLERSHVPNNVANQSFSRSHNANLSLSRSHKGDSDKSVSLNLSPAKNMSLSRSHEGDSDKSVSPKLSPAENQKATSVVQYDVAMIVETSTLEEQVVNMAKMIELLVKRDEAQEACMNQILARLNAENTPTEVREEAETSEQRDPAKGK